MKQKLSGNLEISKNKTPVRSQSGYSIIEMLLALCILIPIMAGAMQLFSAGVNQQASEQSSIEANQDATAGFNMMMLEIAQAGSHGDAATTIQGSVTGSTTLQAVPVASTDGLNHGDWIEAINSSGQIETVVISAVGSNTVTAAFNNNYAVGDKIRLFALPYLWGVLPPTMLAANTATNVTTLRFFGNIFGDGNLYYVEYVYDNANGQITRSITRYDETQKGPAIPLITDISPNSAQFTLHTDERGFITSVTASLTVENQWETASQLERNTLSSTITIPSTRAASILLDETQRYGGVYMFPPPPLFIVGHYEMPS